MMRGPVRPSLALAAVLAAALGPVSAGPRGGEGGPMLPADAERREAERAAAKARAVAKAEAKRARRARRNLRNRGGG